MCALIYIKNYIVYKMYCFRLRCVYTAMKNRVRIVFRRDKEFFRSNFTNTSKTM